VCNPLWQNAPVRDAGHIPKLRLKLRYSKLAGASCERGGSSHAQGHLVRCCCYCVGPDWRGNMDWRRDRNTDRGACWFDYRSISDDDECKGSAYFALS
jgi:hypothetical protein